MSENMINTLKLEDDIAEVNVIVEKIDFLLSELDKYDYNYEITPYKALEYARKENTSEDCELSYQYCMDHKRIMYLYHIMRDYVYEAEKKLEELQNSII